MIWLKVPPDGEDMYTKKLTYDQVAHRILNYHRPYHERLKLILKNTNCDAVKIESNYKNSNIIRSLVKAKIPVMGHIGVTPQTAKGKFKSKGKTKLEKQKLIRESIDLYSNAFLNKINLKFIVLCKDLEVASIPALGVPNHPLKTIIININTDDYRLSRTIHHEIFHMIDNSYPEFFEKNIWRELNNKDFSYAACSTCTDLLGLNLEIINGFLTEYSMSTACLLYTSPSPRDRTRSRMPSSA